MKKQTALFRETAPPENPNAIFSATDVPVQYFGTTNRQLGLRSSRSLLALHDSFLNICAKLKRKKLDEMGEGLKGDSVSPMERWHIPLRIIAFCCNRIRQLEAQPELLEDFEYIPWFKFKEMMFDVYDHRILHAPELNGSVNTNYCALNEHFLVYFVDQLRKREKAEERLVTFLLNLHYYQDYWQRAKQFVMNLELYQNKTTTPQRHQTALTDFERTNDSSEDPYFQQPHAFIGEQELSDNDIYCQEFFLHAYSLLSSDRRNFLESKEGMTYVRVKHHDKMAPKIITLIKGPIGDFQKWNLKVRRLVKKIRNKSDQEVDYLDFDMIIGMMISEYKDQRFQYQKDLLKQFRRVMEGPSSATDLDNFIDVLNSSIPDYDAESKHANPLMQFPGQLSRIRAYLYALMASDSNTSVIHDATFVVACNRYALENPVPSVITKCALYGNNKDVMQKLEEAEEKYGAGTVSIDAKQFSSVTMGLPQKKAVVKKPTLLMKLNEKEDVPLENEANYDALRKKEYPANETIKDNLVRDENHQIQSLKQETVHQMQAEMDKGEKDAYEKQYHLVAGVKYKIQAIRKKNDVKEAHAKINLNQQAEFDGFEYEYATKDQAKMKFESLNKNEHSVVTKHHAGVSRKQIIVPSFETTAKLFNQHFLIMQELRHKIKQLKQAYVGQMDKRKSWAQVDEILRILNIGCQYLDFPEEEELLEMLSERKEEVASLSASPQKKEKGKGEGKAEIAFDQSFESEKTPKKVSAGKFKK